MLKNQEFAFQYCLYCRIMVHAHNWSSYLQSIVIVIATLSYCMLNKKTLQHIQSCENIRTITSLVSLHALVGECWGGGSIL